MMKQLQSGSLKLKTKKTLEKQFVALAAVLVLSITACTEKRDPEFADGEGENVFLKSFFEGAAPDVYLGKATPNAQKSEAESLEGKRSEIRAFGETNLIEVSGVATDRRIEEMFKNLQVQGQDGESFPVEFKLDKNFVTAFKVVKTSTRLTAQESQIAENNDGKFFVPIFKYAVQEYGVVTRRLNDLKEETTSLRLKPTDWASATHLKVSTRASDRVAISVPSESVADRVFLKDRLDGKRLTSEELHQYLDIKTGLAKETKLLLKVADDGLAIFRYTDEKTFLESLNNDMSLLSDLKNGEKVQYCKAFSKDELAAIPSQIAEAEKAGLNKKARELSEKKAFFESEECLVVYVAEVSITYVVAKETKGLDGIKTGTIEYEISTGKSSNLIEISKNPAITRFNPSKEVLIANPSRMLPVKDLIDSEFLMRRTLQDSPNGFKQTFPGSAGPLEIVKFDFKKDRVRIVKADSLIKSNSGETDVDQEELMSLPVDYYKQVFKDGNGNTLAQPKWEIASLNDPAAIAMVDWTQNSIPNVSSPLNYYELEQCFAGERAKEISDVSQRLSGEKGILNFTLRSTYAASPSVDCAGIYQAGYWDSVQTTFSFKERISFMKYNRAKELEKPLLDLPYTAQKKLGFGLFTYKKTVPNKFGNTGQIGTEVALPAIYDIKNGKKITYVLAGLPTEKDQNGLEMRAKIIQATREVVADINVAFAKALKGTPMERSGDVVELKVEGEPGTEGKKLGDLDTNFIYYVKKTTSTGIIGLGGNHSNPRSGQVEAASVFMYGGNIHSSVEWVKKANQARAEYLMSMVSQVSTPQPPAPSAPGTDDQTPGTDSEKDPSEGSGSSGESEERAGANLANFSLGKLFKAPSLKFDASNLKQQRDISDMITELASAAGISQQMGTRNEIYKDQAFEDLKHSSADLAIAEAFKKAVKGGNLLNSKNLEALLTEAILKREGAKLSDYEKSKLKAKANSQKATAELYERMNDANICLRDGAEIAMSMSGKMAESMTAAILAGSVAPQPPTDTDLHIAIYKPTLAHELGHNLGLRHNFIGSFDKSNFKFEANEVSGRQYSTVMDYIPDDHDHYDGMGPQDVHALRAAYAGVVEVSDAVAKAVVEKNGKKVLPIPSQSGSTVEYEIFDGKYMKISDYKKALGLKTWTDLSQIMTTRVLPLKQYSFCSDEEAGYYPTCNRHDIGTTPVEIVQNVTMDHRALYSLRNFANDRLQFGWWDAGGYIGSLFRRLTPVRQFLEETIYLLINGVPVQELQPYIQAVFMGRDFFHEIVRTPDSPALTQGDERITQITDANGNTVKVERKWLQNMAQDEDRLSVRGIEFDKIIAMILLTERRMGFPRYEKVSLRFSFPQFEKIASPPGTTPLQMPTISLLLESMINKISPMATTIQVNQLGQISTPFVSLDNRFKSEVSEMMRTYAVLQAMMSLDIEGLEAADNISSLFRVMSGFEIPTGVSGMTPPGAQAGSKNDLSYWAYDEAAVASTLIKKGKGLSEVTKVQEKLNTLMKEWITVKYNIQPIPPGTMMFAPEMFGETSEVMLSPTGGIVCPDHFSTEECKVASENAFASAEESEEAETTPGAATPGSPATPGIPAAPGTPAAPGLAKRDLPTIEQDIDAILAGLPADVQPRKMSEVAAMIDRMKSLAERLIAMQQKLPAREFSLIVDGISTQVENIAKDAPVIAVALIAMQMPELKLPILGSLMNPSQVSAHRTTVFRNAQFLNRFFYQLHPEFNR